MNNLDSQLIFEAYREEVLDEGLKDVAKKAVQYGAIGAASAASLLGSPSAKAAPAVDPAPISQTAQAETSDSFKSSPEFKEAITKLLNNKNVIFNMPFNEADLATMLKKKDPKTLDTYLKFKNNMRKGIKLTHDMSQEDLYSLKRLADYVGDAKSSADFKVRIKEIMKTRPDR